MGSVANLSTPKNGEILIAATQVRGAGFGSSSGFSGGVRWQAVMFGLALCTLGFI